MPTSFITLPRSELYDLVWSKPVRDVARHFGKSDAALMSDYVPAAPSPASEPVTRAGSWSSYRPGIAGKQALRQTQSSTWSRHIVRTVTRDDCSAWRFTRGENTDNAVSRYR